MAGSAVKLYTAWFCPFAQRAWIASLEKKVRLILFLKFQIAHMSNRTFISIIMYPFLKSFIFIQFGTVRKERTSFIIEYSQKGNIIIGILFTPFHIKKL